MFLYYFIFLNFFFNKLFLRLQCLLRPFPLLSYIIDVYNSYIRTGDKNEFNPLLARGGHH